MLRRPSKSSTTLDLTKQQLAQREAELRAQKEKLEQMIADAPRVAEEEARRNREDLRRLAGAERTRLDVSLAVEDKRYNDFGGSGRPVGALRKQKREGQIIFLVLVIALAIAMTWLLTHLQIF
jgi:septal ring factor EnvC (AmiA/AmiB activator)